MCGDRSEVLVFSFSGLPVFLVVKFSYFRVSDCTMADPEVVMAGVQEQLKELKEQQAIAKELSREAEIKSQGRS